MKPKILTKRILMAFEEEKLARVRIAAYLENKSFSQWCREVLWDAAQQQLKGVNLSKVVVPKNIESGKRK